MKIFKCSRGGGSKGAAIVGEKRAYFETLIRQNEFEGFAGTSIGAVDAALDAFQVSISDQWQLWIDAQKSASRLFGYSTKFININLKVWEGLFKINTKLLNELFNGHKIGDAKKKLIVMITDETVRKPFIAPDDWSVVEAIECSAAFPMPFFGIKSKYRIIDGIKHSFSDGGIMTNLPLKQCFDAGAEKVIAFIVNYSNEPFNAIYNPIKRIQNIIDLAHSASEYYQKLIYKDRTEFINIKTGREVKVLDFRHCIDIMQEAYEDAKDRYLNLNNPDKK